jgi:hypothetical protein
MSRRQRVLVHFPLLTAGARRRPGRSSRRALAILAALALIGVGLPAQVMSADSPPGDTIGAPLGIMLDGSPAHRPGRLGPFLSCPQPPPSQVCNMTYHGGDLVLGPHTVYVVYWEPAGSTVSANYHALIERYLHDVAADSGRVTNVYATDTQYDDSGSNFIQYNVSWGGAFTDTTAFPARNASCPITDGTRTAITCLSQTQQSDRLDAFIQANSLPRGLGNIYFQVLPQNVETCDDAFSFCGNFLDLGNRYCAYHSSFDIGGHGLTLWANEPYINIPLGHCDSGSRPSPNGDDADHAINALSHEHNETITDPTNGGWFEVNGAGENGDKCNFQYGPAIGNNGTDDYNQIINHHQYEFQLEWSNAITGCAANFGAVDPTAAFTWSPATPLALDPVSFDGTGSHSNNSGGYLIEQNWDFGDSASDTGATTSHAYAAPGTYSVTLAIKDDAGLTDSVTHDVTVVQRPTTTTYTGETSGDYHDQVTLSGHLEDATTHAPLSGQSLTMAVGSQSCSHTTNGSGDASCTVTLSQIPAASSADATFAGDTVYAGSTSGGTAFTIAKEETTIAYTGPTVILAGAAGATLTAHLVEDGANDDDADGGSPAPDPSGQSVTLALGSQTCVGTTNSSGDVACTISSVSVPLGPQPLVATFSGDDYYKSSVDASKSAIVFAFPSNGAFALGNLTVASATPTTTLTWWGSEWSLSSSLTGGPAPTAFKGFGGAVTTLPTTSPANVCGTSFGTNGGNSPPPPTTVPSYMGVVVSTGVTKAGSNINGTWNHIVVVRVAPGYDSNPGHPGRGTIVATFC